MTKIVLCEDEQIFANQMMNYLDSWGKLIKEKVVVRWYQSIEELLFKKEEWTDAQCFLLDVEMGKLTGMDFAKMLREWENRAGIIFITGYEKYVFEGYEVGACAYILKPVDEKKLFAALNRVYEDCKKQPQSVLIKTEDGVVRLFTEDILYIESFGHDTSVHTVKETYVSHLGINQYKELLDDKLFCMPHRSYLVNARGISKLGKKDITMEDGMVIPIARGKQKEINLCYMQLFHS